MTRTEKLAAKIKKIYSRYESEIAALPTTGPMGGKNARHIPGWNVSPNGVITRAVNLKHLPTLPFWSGGRPSPQAAIPECVAWECLVEYRKIFSR